MKSLTVGQILALNHTMTDYPADKSLELIFDLIVNDDEAVIVHEYFSDWDESALFNFITELAQDIDQEIKLAML